MFRTVALVSFVFSSLVAGQLAGTQQTETHPRMSMQVCTAKNRCQTSQRPIVLDSNWRWTHNKDGYENCYEGNSWNTQYCPDGATCARNCALEGVDYRNTYGISTSGNALTMKFVTEHEYGTNVGGRVYLMENDNAYYMFKLMNKEFTFDVDVSKLPCGLNGALYFISMEANGGLNKGGNKAGAKFGTGYCDAQCPHDIKV